MKLYTVMIGGTQYRIRAGGAAEAVKKAVRTWLDGRDEPKELSLSLTAREVPVIEEIEKAEKVV